MKPKLSPTFPDSIGTTEEFDGRMRCAICNGWYRSVGIHAHHAHGITADDYRTMFGLTQGLVSQASKAKYKIQGHNNYAKHGLTPVPGATRPSGHTMKPQTRLRISESQKARLQRRPQPTGVPRTPEDRQAISAGVKRWHQRRNRASKTAPVVSQ